MSFRKIAFEEETIKFYKMSLRKITLEEEPI